jgi:RimJ/RimL family protein N-acetyltransferase
MSIRLLREAHVSGLRLVVPESVVDMASALQSSGNGYAYCLLLSNTPVGIVALTNDGELMAYTNASHRRRGFATSALENLVKRAQAADMPRVHARARKNTSGAGVAVRLGLNVVGESDEEIFFEKRFRPKEQIT